MVRRQAGQLCVVVVVFCRRRQKKQNKTELIFLGGTARENKWSRSELEFLSVLSLSLPRLFYHGTASEQTGTWTGSERGNSCAVERKKEKKIPS